MLSLTPVLQVLVFLACTTARLREVLGTPSPLYLRMHSSTVYVVLLRGSIFDIRVPQRPLPARTAAQHKATAVLSSSRRAIYLYPSICIPLAGLGARKEYPYTRTECVTCFCKITHRANSHIYVCR
jgi:hypothetical protein